MSATARKPLSSRLRFQIDPPLWWPAGVGGQPLYRVNATLLHPAHGSAAVTAERSIGFRHVALVTGNDTDPSYVRQAAGAEGSDRHGM